MRLEYDGTGEEFRVIGRPAAWSEQAVANPPGSAQFGSAIDLHPLGDRFVIAAPDGPAEARALNTYEVVLDFFALLRRQAPAE